MAGFDGEDLTLLSWPSFPPRAPRSIYPSVLDNNDSLKCLKHCDHEEIQFARTYRVIYENKVKLKFGMTFFFNLKYPRTLFLIYGFFLQRFFHL
jgi:hypothetical protein